MSGYGNADFCKQIMNSEMATNTSDQCLFRLHSLEIMNLQIYI